MNDTDLDDIYEESVPLFEGSLIEKGVPPLTRWRNLRGILNRFWVTKNDPEIRYTHFQIKFFPYMAEVIVILVTYLAFLKFYLPYLPTNNNNEKYFFFALKNFQIFLMTYIWGTSMFCIIYSHMKNPGYLPYYFPALYYNSGENDQNSQSENKNTHFGRKKFTLDELKSGTAVTSEQIEWARKQRRPQRVRFSAASGYYIIRGDHICQYINNWVGLYNHRWFILAVVYLILYILDYMFVYFYEHFVTKNVNAPTYITTIQLIIGIPFLLLMLNNLFNQCIGITYNLTLLDIYRKQYPNYSKGSCLSNWEDVFGPKKYLPFWFLPVPLPLISDGFDYHARQNPDEPYQNYEYENYGTNIGNNTDQNQIKDNLKDKESDENNNLMFDPLLFTRSTRNRNI